MNPTKGDIVTHIESGAEAVVMDVFGSSASVSVLRGGVNLEGSTIEAGDRALWLICNLQSKAEQ